MSGQVIGDSVFNWAQGFIYPAFIQTQVIAFQQNRHLLSTFTAAKITKMAQSFSNNHNSFNVANTFNTTVSDDRSEILAWLSPLEPRVRHRDIGARRVNSIGAWLLETEEFKRWNNGSRGDGSYNPTLFCDGNPGVGKSYIM